MHVGRRASSLSYAIRKEGFQKNGKKTRLLLLMGGVGLECNKNLFNFFSTKNILYTSCRDIE